MKKQTIFTSMFFALSIFFALGFLVYVWGFMRPKSISLKRTNESIGEYAREGDSRSPVSVDIKIIPPDMTNRHAILKVNEIKFSRKNIPQNAVFVCVQSLRIMVLGSSQVWANNETYEFYSKDKICSSQIKPENSSPNSLGDVLVLHRPISKSLLLENDPFYYPLDGISFQVGGFITFSFWDATKQHEFNEDTITQPELILLGEGAQDWERAKRPPSSSNDFWKHWGTGFILTENGWSITNYNVIIEGNISSQHDDYQSLIKNGITQPDIITFSRSPTASWPFVIIVVSFLILIYLLTLLDSPELFVQGAIAILIGLFGVRAILVPVNIQTRTIVDVYVIGLYVVLLVSTLGQLIKFIPNWKKNRKTSSDDLDTASKVVDISQIPREQIVPFPNTSKRLQTKNILSMLVLLVAAWVTGWFIGRND